MTDVTASHRLRVALCHQHLLWDKGSPYPRQRIWIEGGNANHLRQDEQAWPLIAQAFADIEAEARSAATRSGVVAALEELDELVDENCKSMSFAMAYGKAWETVATKYGWTYAPKGDTDG